MKKSPLAEKAVALGATLRSFGAGEVPWTYGDLQAEIAQLRAGCGLVDLSFEGTLRLKGEDTRRFANSQLTNNFRDMEPGGAARCGITDRKGRLQGLAHGLLLDPNTLLIITDGGDPEWLHDRLDMYIIMDPIELDELSEEFALITLQGPQSAAVLAQVGAPAPAQGHGEWAGGYVVARDRSGLGGFDVLLPAAGFHERVAELQAAGASLAGLGALEALRVAAGQPRWPADMGERAFIHELGLVRELVSFTKGCYMGQEVINRMETMGRLTRQLRGLRLPAEAPEGSEILLNDKAVGVLTSSAWLDGERRGLALLKVAATPGSAVTLRFEGGEAEAEVLELTPEG